MSNTNGHRGRADSPHLVEAEMEHVEPDVPETPPARWRLGESMSAEQMDAARAARLRELGERAS